MNKNAKWICKDSTPSYAVYTFRKDFEAAKPCKRAILSVSAIGVYVPYVNGERVGDSLLAPGWTSYETRVQYASHDVTDMIKEQNSIEIGVGNGWAVGHMGLGQFERNYADHTSLIASLELEYADGTSERICTDESWEVYTSEVTFADIYNGETVDKTASIEKLGNATLSEGVTAKPFLQVGEDVTEQERVFPVELIHAPNGDTIIDFGQNLAGYVEVSVKGKRGDRIVLHHAEVLDKDGNFYNKNYRLSKNEMTYVLSGGFDVFKPRYSFQGFRYVRLCEYPFESIDLSSFCAVVIHSSIKRTGDFCCGNEKINQLYHNVIWGQKSNYVDLPTDCPQRDERLGWTGDTQVFCRTAAINFDVERFFKKWLGDVRIEQREDGGVYGIVPNCASKVGTLVSAAWGDAACIVPWELYRAYGNPEVLEENFELMKKWVDYIHAFGSEEFLWLGGSHYGDWLAMDAGEDSYAGATAKDLIASAYFAYSTSLLVKAGEVLGRDVSEYRELYTSVRRAFRERFMEGGSPKYKIEPDVIVPGTENEKNLGMTQTAISLILYFGLCEENERAGLAERLVSLIEENNGLMATGFVGTPYILHALSENGYASVAYDLLLEERYPSWLYSVCHGATTMWEHWNGVKENGEFWSDAMNSFNHYAYGAVYDWIFGAALGIKPSEDGAGYKKIDIAPHPDRRLGFAKASIDTRNGRVGVHWYYKGDKVYYEIEVPCGVTAQFTLPSGNKKTLCGGKYHFAE